MPNLIETLKKTDSFAQLPNGWRFGKGQPIDLTMIEIGKSLLKAGFENGHCDRKYTNKYEISILHLPIRMWLTASP